MPTITVKLDKQRAARLARWAKRRKVPKSDVIRALIDRAGPIQTGDDLIEWVEAATAKVWGWRRRSREAAGAARQLLSDRHRRPDSGQVDRLIRSPG
jgi:hypothetical protein